MVLTVEPALYIRPDSDAPKEWHGMGIRIEDDIQVTAQGHKVLSSGLVKEIDDIEHLMSQ